MQCALQLFFEGTVDQAVARHLGLPGEARRDHIDLVVVAAAGEILTVTLASGSASLIFVSMVWSADHRSTSRNLRIDVLGVEPTFMAPATTLGVTLPSSMSACCAADRDVRGVESRSDRRSASRVSDRPKPLVPSGRKRRGTKREQARQLGHPMEAGDDRSVVTAQCFGHIRARVGLASGCRRFQRSTARASRYSCW